MSYRIEYNWALFRVAPTETGLADERFVVAIEGGDNNVTVGRSSKRARDWEACMIGTRTGVLKQAVDVAGACAGGSLQPHGRWCTPESYIRRIRRLLDAPPQKPIGWWIPRMRLKEDHPAVALARSHGLELEQQTFYGQPQIVVRFTELQLPLFFDFVDRYSDIRPWRFAEVYGLPNS